MNKPVVYLAGAMTGLTKEEMTAWRDYATYSLQANDLGVWNPADTSINGESTAKEIVDNNQFMITKSDIILAEMLPRENPSLGTISEIVFTGTLGKPVITFGESWVLDYPWVAVNVTSRLKTLDSALDYIITNYGCRVI